MPTSTITGTIRDGSRTPVSGVTVYARLRPGPASRISDGSTIANPPSTTTDASGVYSFVLEQQANISGTTWWEIEEDTPDAQGGRRVRSVSVGSAAASVGASEVEPAGLLGPTALTQAQGDLRYEQKALTGVNVADFLATTTDTVTAFQEADAAAVALGEPLVVPAGTYTPAASLTLASPVVLAGGAKFTVATGITLTFNGGFSAFPYFRIFTCTGTGKVVFGDGVLEDGYSEWWGAKVNNGGAAGATTLAALTAAIAACPTVRLFGGDYFISAGLVINDHHRTLRGHAPYWRDANSPATRIVLQSAAGQVLTVTPAVDPGTDTSGFTRAVKLSDFELTRNVAPAPNSAGNELTGPIGLLLAKTLDTVIERVYTTEHSVGFALNGTIRTNLVRCRSFRSLVGTGANTANDKFWAYYLNGDANIGLAGGNATTLVTDCNAVLGGTPALVEAIGMLLTTSYVDTFLQRFETAGAFTKGLWAAGTRTGSAGAQKTGNADLHIIGCIFDGWTERGVYIADASDYGAINITDCYAAPASGASTVAAYQVASTDGAVNLSGCQAICWPTASTVGVFISGSRSVMVRDTQIVGSARPVLVQGSSLFHIEVVIQSPLETPTEAAVLLDSTGGGNSRGYVKPTIVAGAHLFPIGVNLASTVQDHIEVNCTLIDPAALTSGSANKLVINGTQVTATGLSGTNLASGVMA